MQHNDRVHCSSDPHLITNLRPRRADEYKTFNKPHGLWLSPLTKNGKSKWQNWCESAGFGCNQFEYHVRVDESKILIISTSEEFDKFWNEYKQKHDVRWILDWTRIGEQFSGVEFRKFSRLKSVYRVHISDVGELFAKFSFIASLDCCCSCVWDIEAIVSLQKSDRVIT